MRRTITDDLKLFLMFALVMNDDNNFLKRVTEDVDHSIIMFRSSLPHKELISALEKNFDDIDFNNTTPIQFDVLVSALKDIISVVSSEGYENGINRVTFRKGFVAFISIMSEKHSWFMGMPVRVKNNLIRIAARRYLENMESCGPCSSTFIAWKQGTTIDETIGNGEKNEYLCSLCSQVRDDQVQY
mgnify:FL=1